MKFKVGDKVFGKVRGFPYWPAVITDIQNENQPNARYSVLFYGSKESSTIKLRDLYPFIENRNKLGRPRKIKYFNVAMDEIIADLSPEERKRLPSEEVQEDSPPKIKKVAKSEDQTNTSEPNNKESEISRYGRKQKPKTFPDDVIFKSTETLTLDGSEAVTFDLNYLKFYETEYNLLRMDVGIRSCLNYTSPNLRKCIILLEELLKLELSQLLLKKHPDIVVTISNAFKYWAPHAKIKSEEKVKLLDSQAEEIRDLAGQILHKFENYFTVPSGVSFAEYFRQVKNEFYAETERMSLQELVNIRE